MRRSMDAQLTIRMPADVMAAAEAAADRRQSRVGAYVRQAVLLRLVVDGEISREQVEGRETVDDLVVMDRLRKGGLV